MSIFSTPLKTVPVQPVNIDLPVPVSHLKQTIPKASTHESNGTLYISVETQPPFKRARISDHLVGPPPSFEANILEVETDIAFANKRAEAAREYARNSHAIDPVTPPELSATAAQSGEASDELASKTRSAKQSNNSTD